MTPPPTNPPLVLRLRVCRSAAGYYAGYWCPWCGPYDRIGDYSRAQQEASEWVEFLRKPAPTDLDAAWLVEQADQAMPDPTEDHEAYLDALAANTCADCLLGVNAQCHGQCRCEDYPMA